MPGYKFLIDVNLPHNFSFFQGHQFTHVIELDNRMPDEKIWEYAKSNGQIIVTRDSDFYHRCLIDSEVKVIHFALGNIRLKALHLYFHNHWETIISYLGEARLIQVTQDEIRIVIEE